MKQNIIAIFSIFAVVASVGWKLANHSETATGLQDISLIQNSEHSHQGPMLAALGIRIRLSPSDFGYEIVATTHTVPQISVVAE